MNPRLSLVAFTAIVALAGCGGAIPSNTGTESPQTASTPVEFPTPPSGPHAYPEPPTELSNESVKEVAFGYQDAWIYNILHNQSHITDFGTGGPLPQKASILNRSENGVYVKIQYGYWYSTSDSEADVPTTATYFVSRTNVRRINGTEIFIR